MWWTILRKKQTTLPGFDRGQVKEMVKPKNHNFWIAAKPGSEELSSKELSDLKDGKEIALPIKNAELMQQMGLVQIIENKKKTKEK